MKALRELSSYLVGLVLATLVMLGCSYATSYVIFSGGTFESGASVYTLTACLLGFTLLFGWRFTRRRLGLSGPPFARHIRITLLALHFATWIAGVPAVLSRL